MDRRHFLHAGAALLGSTITTRLFAAPATDTKLLFVFLRGAYDAANTVVPISSDLYYESRPTIAIPRPGKGKSSALELNTDWGLHPVLGQSLKPLLDQKQVLFVPFVGIPGVSRSHFEAQEWLEVGASDVSGEGAKVPKDGMLFRLAEQLGAKTQTAAFTDSPPSAFAGSKNTANIGLDRRPNLGSDQGLRDELLKTYQGSQLEATLRDGLTLQREVGEVFDEEQQDANRGANSASGFEREIGRVANLMRDRFNLAFIDVGGWDTHANQGGVSGALAARLQNLGAGLSAYAKAMGPDWKRTVVVVVSEFGRTMRETNSKGTDHGYGTTYWVLGGSVPGGKILAGEQKQLKRPDDLNEQRDLPVLNDYRAVLGGIYQDVYGLNAQQIQAVFGNGAPKPQKLIRPLV